VLGLYRNLIDFIGWDHFDASEIGFKELYEMFVIVTQQLGQEAIVIDADDLLTHPGQYQR